MLSFAYLFVPDEASGEGFRVRTQTVKVACFQPIAVLVLPLFSLAILVA